jgi:hypothetical protein
VTSWSPAYDGNGQVRDGAWVGFEDSATINRDDWGVHWNATPEVVSKKVTLEFDVAAIRQP